MKHKQRVAMASNMRRCIEFCLKVSMEHSKKLQDQHNIILGGKHSLHLFQELRKMKFIPSNAAEHMVALWVDPTKEKPLILRHNRNWDPFDADKNDH